MIYAMQPVGGGPLKIGTSENVAARHRQLESMYGCELVILATFEGGRDCEREIHERFSHLRLGRTEQFQPGADLMAFLGRPLLVDPNPEAVEAMPTTGLLSLASLRGSARYAEWLTGLSKHARLPMTILMEHALRLYAKNHGYSEPEPDRR